MMLVFLQQIIQLEGSYQISKECDLEYIENDIISIFKEKDLKKLSTVIPKKMAFSFSGEDNLYTFKNIENELKGHELTKLLFDQTYLAKRWAHKLTPFTFQYIMTEVFLKNKEQVYSWVNEYPFYDKDNKKEYKNITIGLDYQGYRYVLDIYCNGRGYIIYRFEIGFE
jgi:hypothetical protein